MERVWRSVLLIVAAGLIVQTARPHYRYGAWLDATATIALAGLLIPFGMGAIMVLLHVAKAMMLAVAAWFWRRAHYAYGVLAVLLFLLLLPVSITSTFGFLDLQRGERASREASTQKREADLCAELTSVQAWLKDGGWRRAAALVESDIAAERRSPFWTTTSGCRDGTSRPQKRYCQALDRLAGELAGASEAEDYRRREKDIYLELQSAKPTTASRHPDLEFLSRALSVSIEQAGFWRTVLFAAAIEAVEALLLLFGSVPARNHLQGRKRGQRIVFGLLSTCWLFHDRATSKPRHCVDDPWALAIVEGAKPAAETQDVPNATAADARHVGSTSTRPEEQARPPSQRDRSNDPSPRPDAAAWRPEQAVAAFVAELPRAPDARVRGSAMRAAYETRRQAHGWPRLSPGQFGRHLKPAIEAAGGRKVKANCQIYVGVAL